MKETTKRVYYIDNLRWMTVSLLILYHAAMAYNTWGEANYIFLGAVKPISSVVVFISPWFMPLMFLLAGISSKFSLRKRGYKTFICERFKRLGIPFIFGMVVINPVLSYIADVTHNGYSGNYFSHYGVFFTRYTDLTGYDGGFTLGHFWFIAVLMVISLLSCLIIRLVDMIPERTREKARLLVGVLLFVVAIASYEITAFGKSLLTYLFLYLLGYYYFSNPEIVKGISKFKWLFTGVFVPIALANAILYVYVGDYPTLNTICMYGSLAFGVLALFSLGYDYLDFTGKFSRFNAKVSYVHYIIHFPIVVLCQYCFSLINVGSIANFFMTLVVSYPITYTLCYVIDKTRYFRVVFGLKSKKNN